MTRRLAGELARESRAASRGAGSPLIGLAARIRGSRRPRAALLALCVAAAAVAARGIAAPAPAPRAQPVELPKYGPAAVRLHDDRSYLREQEAPDFWALLPYYLPQLTDSSCSVASVAMLINALRADLPLRSDEKLATHRELLERTASAAWQKAVAQGGDGVSLDELGRLIEQSLAAYKLEGHRVEVVHTRERSDPALARLREALTENEASSRDFIVANFLQGTLTGDPQGNVSHIAPIAAYDAGRRRVLVLDPDRDWYEPYWVSDQSLLEAMTTTDSTVGRSRGFVWIRLLRERTP